MTPICTPEALFLGMKLVDWLTIIGLLLGPIFAVLISLWREERRHKRHQQIHTLRQLVNSRDRANDPNFLASINVIPIDFNGNDAVMSAWKDYIKSIQARVPDDQKADQNKNSRIILTKLIFEMTKALKYKLPESDIQTPAYQTEGYDRQQSDQYEALKAMPKIADTLEKNHNLLSIIYQQPKGDGL